MAYISLYRKYRSQSFDDLIGQQHVVKTLQNAISSGRIAHSYLFTGPRGTGKTSTARLLAKALNAEGGPNPAPDENSEMSRMIAEGSCPDVIEMDAASESGVDDIREQIIESVEYRPIMCHYKIFIIDEVHDLSNKAFDALLKTVEEPPEHIIFILATTEYNKVPPTIRSRCQKFEFHRANLADLTSRLRYVAEQEGVQIDPSAVTAIARMADGGFRDALTLLEQAMLTTDGTITVDLVYDQLGLISDEVVDALLFAMKEQDVPLIMDRLAEIARLGRDPRAILESMLHRLSDLTRAAYQVDSASGKDAPQEAALHDVAARLTRDFILRLRGDLADAHRVIRDISLPRVWLESEFIRLSMRISLVPAAPSPAVAPAGRQMPSSAVVRPPSPDTGPVTQRTASDGLKAPSTVATAPVVSADPWTGVLDRVRAVSRTIVLKLGGATVELNADKKLKVTLGSEQFHTWFNEKPEALKVVKEAILASYGGGIDLELALEKRDADTGDQVAVELPAEGQRLEQLTRDVFGV